MMRWCSDQDEGVSHSDGNGASYGLVASACRLQDLPVTRDFVKFREASATDWDAISLTEVTIMLNTGKNGFSVPQSAYKTL